MSTREIVIDCTDLFRPRWERIIRDKFQDIGGEIANIVPIFHIRKTDASFGLGLTLEGATFEDDIEGDLRFWCRGLAGNPLDYAFESANRLVVNWNGFVEGQPRPQVGRWIQRFFVGNGSGWRQPIHVAFMYVSAGGVSDLVASEPIESQATVKVEKEDSRSIRLGIELAGREPPKFFEWDGDEELFDETLAPENTYLEPLFVVKKANHPIDFEFKRRNGEFTYRPKDACNPVYGNDSDPVALHWCGVTHDSPAKCNPATAAGFRGSRWGSKGNPKSRSEACIHWLDDGRNGMSIASFFFLDDGAAGLALADPTIIYDPPKPPRG